MGNQRFSISPAKAARDTELPDTVFRTLAVLGIYGDEDGWCFPSLRTIAKSRGISHQAVSKHIALLVEKGYLNIQRRSDEENGNLSNLYQIRFDRPLSTSEVTPLSTSEIDTLATSEVDITPHVNAPLNDQELGAPKNGAEPELTPHQQLFGILVETTGLDPKLMRGKIGKFSQMILKAGYAPAEVEGYYSPGGWWYVHDWRGKERGQPPTLEQIVSTLADAQRTMNPAPRARRTVTIQHPDGKLEEVEVT